MIKGVLSVYDLQCKYMFTCGQQAYADYMQVLPLPRLCAECIWQLLHPGPMWPVMPA